MGKKNLRTNVRSVVKKILEGRGEDREFVKGLTTLALRSQELLRPCYAHPDLMEEMNLERNSLSLIAPFLPFCLRLYVVDRGVCEVHLQLDKDFAKYVLEHNYGSAGEGLLKGLDYSGRDLRSGYFSDEGIPILEELAKIDGAYVPESDNVFQRILRIPREKLGERALFSEIAFSLLKKRGANGEFYREDLFEFLKGRGKLDRFYQLRTYCPSRTQLD